MQQINHKRNEIQDVEFFKDEKCTEDFDFTNSKNIYINGEFDLQATNCVIESGSENAQIFIPYIPQDCINSIMSAIISRNCDNTEPDDYDDVKVFTLTQIEKMWDEDKIEGITPNLSKYIPEDNAVLFLTQEDTLKYSEIFKDRTCAMLNKVTLDVIKEKNTKKITIFLPHGTQSELQKANEVGKYLEENFGIKPDVFVLHWFKRLNNNDWRFNFLRNIIEEEENAKGIWHGNDFGKFVESKYEERIFINKIITTNSTGILKPEDSNERLQVIDCKAIFEEYLKESNF